MWSCALVAMYGWHATSCYSILAGCDTDHSPTTGIVPKRSISPRWSSEQSTVAACGRGYHMAAACGRGHRMASPLRASERAVDTGGAEDGARNALREDRWGRLGHEDQLDEWRPMQRWKQLEQQVRSWRLWLVWGHMQQQQQCRLRRRVLQFVNRHHSV